MYIPEWFRLEDESLVLEVMTDNSFATLYSQVDGQPFASHLPILVAPGDPLVLYGHMAKANPQTRCLDGKQSVMVVFQGPHAYVSPRDYETAPNVPTWNYIVVHATGRAERLEDPATVIGSIQGLVDQFDPSLSETHPEAVEPQFWESKLHGLVAFRLRVDSLEAKAKMSQNRPARDQRSVVNRLAQSSIPGDVQTAAIVSKLNKLPD